MPREAEEPALPAFDTAALVARLKADDEEALAQAYRLTFGTEWGRYVLAHILSEGGVGRKFHGRLEGKDLAYHQGAHDFALEIFDRAGHGPADAVVTVMTGHVEGHSHVHETEFAEPDPEFD